MKFSFLFELNLVKLSESSYLQSECDSQFSCDNPLMFLVHIREKEYICQIVTITDHFLSGRRNVLHFFDHVVYHRRFTIINPALLN